MPPFRFFDKKWRLFESEKTNGGEGKMELQSAAAWVILLLGALYGAALLRTAWKKKAQVKEEPGRFWQHGSCQGIVYFFTTMGFPDFLLNTALLRKLGWVEDRCLPGTLVASSLVPGAVIAYVYLQSGAMLDMKLLLSCVAAIALGSFLGARVVTQLRGETIRTIMGAAMLFSMAALLLKMAISSGAAGTATALSSVQLAIALPIVCFFGFINMFGVPMKPPAIALFLLLGLSPMATLTLVMAMGIASPLAGGVRVLRSGLYGKKSALAALSFGTAGVLLGAAFTITLDAAVLTAILLFIMAATALSMLRPKRAEK